MEKIDARKLSKKQCLEICSIYENKIKNYLKLVEKTREEFCQNGNVSWDSYLGAREASLDLYFSDEGKAFFQHFIIDNGLLRDENGEVKNEKRKKQS